eukprot:Em0002g1474a
MQFSDRPGYETLRECFPRLSVGLSDPSILGAKLFATGLITEYTKQAALSQPVLVDKITALLEGVMRQGSKGAFQRFAEMILQDAATAELGLLLKESYMKKNGVWKDEASGQKSDGATGQ